MGGTGRVGSWGMPGSWEWSQGGREGKPEPLLHWIFVWAPPPWNTCHAGKLLLGSLPLNVSTVDDGVSVFVAPGCEILTRGAYGGGGRGQQPAGRATTVVYLEVPSRGPALHQAITPSMLYFCRSFIPESNKTLSSAGRPSFITPLSRC